MKKVLTATLASVGLLVAMPACSEEEAAAPAAAETSEVANDAGAAEATATENAASAEEETAEAADTSEQAADTTASAEGSSDAAATTEEAPAEETAEAASDEETQVASVDGGYQFANSFTTAAGETLTGNATAGAKVFNRCKQCHVLEPGQNRQGPSLYGILGRTAGTIEGFNYSKANSESGIVWTSEIMFEYLENPRKYMPGTRMAFVGLRQAQQRADVIAYIAEATAEAAAE